MRRHKPWYGPECWTLTAQQQSRSTAADMRLLRPLAEYSLLDHKRNDDVRQELNILSIFDSPKIVMTHSHVTLNCKSTGTLNIGRLWDRWISQGNDFYVRYISNSELAMLDYMQPNPIVIYLLLLLLL